MGKRCPGAGELLSMRWDSVGDLNCSVARTLAIVGERWTMLILRDAFLGHRRFDEFQAGTGIARNILSSRLRELVANGILERVKAEGEVGRIEYRLTKKGIDLYPVVVAMLKWGDTWLVDEHGPPLTLIHRTCGARTTPVMVCPQCGQHIAARDMVAIPRRPAHHARRAARSSNRQASR
jgi:DNA-binding HxlR family transcriptional regulator